MATVLKSFLQLALACCCFFFWDKEDSTGILENFGSEEWADPDWETYNNILYVIHRHSSFSLHVLCRNVIRKQRGGVTIH